MSHDPQPSFGPPLAVDPLGLTPRAGIDGPGAFSGDVALDALLADVRRRVTVERRPSDVLAADEPAWGSRMRDFLTDGSVAALCDELARLAGAPIWLRDQNGEAIAPEWASSGTGERGHPWSMVPEAQGRARAFRNVGIADDGSPPLAVPLRISTGTLGWIVACLPHAGGGGAERARTIQRALALLASSVCDVCEAQVALRRRVRELDALYKLTELMTSATDVDEILHVALDVAVSALHVDAGSVAVIEDGPGGREPIIRAHAGLSRAWVESSMPLSRGGLLRQAALAGEVVSVLDLTADERIADQERARAEGLVSMISTGLLDQGRPIGLIRLYTRLARGFTEAEGELLRAIAEHAASAVTNVRLRRLRAQDEAVKRQVRLAAAVQRRMLPRSTPQVPPFDIAAYYAPSFELGGDFYDFLELGGHLGIVIGDVAGKGVPAALLMSAVRASLRAHSQDVYDIDEVLSRVNRALVRDTLDNEFATVWYGVADPHTLRLTYCGAGHDWPLLISVPPAAERPVDERDVRRLTADGMALGIDPTQRYPKGMFQLRERDVLVAYTDGLHDAADFEGRRFGGTRLRRALLDLLRDEPEAGAGRIVEHVMGQVRQHTGLAGRSDDITVFVLRVARP